MICSLWLGLSSAAISATAQVPNAMTLEGQLFSDTAATVPLLDTGTLTIQILDPNQTCVIYEQSQALDTRASEGRFTALVGAAVGASPRTTGSGLDVDNAMALVYSNVNSTGIPGKYAGGAACTYVPQNGDGRFVRTIVATDSDHQTRTLAPDLDLRSYPTALVAGSAETLKGFGPASFLQLATPGNADLTQTNVENVFSHYADLITLLGGTSNAYMQSGAATAALPRPAVQPTNATAAANEGRIWYDPTTHMIRYSDGSTVNSVGAAGRGLSNLSVGTGLQSTAGTTISTGGQTVSVNAGTGASQVVQLDTSARLPAVDASRLANLNASMLSTGTVSVPVNTSGSVTASESRLGSLKVFNGANYVDLRAPASLATNYALTWPAALPSSGSFVLAANGTGAMSFVDLNGGVVTNQADLAFGRIWIGDMFGKAQPRQPSGDVSLDSAGAFKVVALQNIPVSATAPTNGQVLGWNGTTSAWQPVAVSNGTVQSVSAGAGLLGGTITSTGSLSVDVGNAAAKIVQENSNAQIAQAAGSAGLPSYAFEGDVTTGLYSPGTGTLNIATAGTGRLTILPNGNVGIGTFTPTTTLAVTGVSAFRRTGTWTYLPTGTTSVPSNSSVMNLGNTSAFDGNAVLIQTSIVNSSANSQNGYQGFISTAGTSAYSPPYVIGRSTGPSSYAESIRIDENGRLGIGTSAPARMLSTYANGSSVLADFTANGGAMVDVVSMTGTAGASVRFTGTGLGGISWMMGADPSIAGTPFVIGQGTNFIGLAAPSSKHLALSTSGNLGLGTMTPAAGLDVATTGTGGSALIVPRDSTTNRPSAPVNGMLRYNNSLNVMEAYAGGSWQTLAAQASGGTGFLPLSGGTTSGAIVLASGTASAPSLSFANDPTTGLYSASAGQVNLATAGTARLTISNGGNVGIGTTTPSLALDVAGQIRSTTLNGTVQESLILINTHTGAGSGASILFGNTVKLAQIGNVIEGTTTDSALTFSTRQTTGNPTEKMRITAAGNVGIGSTSPTAALDVVGAIKSTSGGTFQGNVYTGNGSVTSPAHSFVNGVGAGMSYPITNNLAFSTSATERVRIDGAGNVGIGTSTPGALLHVNGNILSNGVLRASYGTVGSPSISFSPNATVGLWRPAPDVLAVSTSSNERLRIDDQGNLGINTTTPALKLDVAGSGVFRGPTVGGVDGELFYDVGTHTYRYYDAGAGAWQALGSGAISYSGTVWNQSGSNINYTSGNVGLRTTSPLNALDVSGAAAVGSYAGSVTAPTNALIVGGRVGVGSAAPATALNVVDTSNSGAIFFDSYFGSGSGNAAQVIGRRAQGTQASPAAVIATERLAMFGASGYNGSDFNTITGAIIMRAEENFTNTTGGTSIRFETAPVGGLVRTERLQIAPNGNILIPLGGALGIGTTSPGAQFDFASSQSALFGLVGGGSGNGGKIAFRRPVDGNTGGRIGYLSSGTANIFGLQDTTGNGEMRMEAIGNAGGFFSIYTTPSGTPIEALRVANNGNLGIATTTPNYPLDVNGIANATGFQTIGAGTGDTGGLRLINTNSAGTSTVSFEGASAIQKSFLRSGFSSGNTDAYLAFSTRTTNAMSEKMRLDASGNLGLGVTSPGYKLDVVGDVNASGCLRSSAGVASGVCVSDERLKTDVKPFELGLDALLGLSPRTFRYNGLGGHVPSEKPELGFVAQEVERSAPDLVSSEQVKLRPRDEQTTAVKRVNYTALVYVIVNALKEMHQRFTGDVSDMKEKIAKLEVEKSQLTERVRALETEAEGRRRESSKVMGWICARDPNADVCH